MFDVLKTEAARIANTALTYVAKNPVSLDEWRITNATKFANYCMLGMDGDDCEEVADRLDLDSDDLREAVWIYLYVGFEHDVHANA